MTTLSDFCKNPLLIYPVLGRRGFFHSMDDEKYLSLSYKANLGHDLNLDDPKGFNEKLQWLKLHDRNPLYTTLVDKYRVKHWVADKIGEEYVTETYDHWDCAEDIDISGLPDRFVLKPNHDSGSIAICRDRSTFDLEAAKKMLAKSLRRNFYWGGREWPYKNVKPLIFAEEYLDPGDGAADLSDYKLFRFSDGHIVTLAMTGRFSEAGPTKTFFDEQWRPLDLSEGNHPRFPEMPAPPHFEKMKNFADMLSMGFPFCRVDFYESGRRLLFGEMTFYPNSGYEHFEPADWDSTFGSWIELEGASLYS